MKPNKVEKAKEPVRIPPGSKMLCPECKTVQTVEHQNELEQVYLSCKHLRSIHTLPKRGVSIEDALASNADVQRLFPPREKSAPDDLSMVFQREKWS